MRDVVVVGAGPAGSATAHFLAARGLDVLLLDRSDFPRDKTCGDGLTPRAVSVLDRMGLLPRLLGVGQRIGGYEVTAPNGRVTGGALPQGRDVPGFALVVRRRVLDQAILDRAVASGAGFEAGVTALGVEPEPDGVRVVGRRDGRPVTFVARLCVVATGAAIGFLRGAGVLRAMPPAMLAARTYLEDVPPLVRRDRLQLHFDGAPLPGYGWVFPVSASAANVGVGYFPGRRSMPTAAAAFERFVGTERMRRLLGGARPSGALERYPIRVDFLTAPRSAERMLLVGEAAGLVNPLTGEGIDYALESGELAAGHLAALFEAGDFSRRRLEAYDGLLVERFERLFRFCGQVRDWYLRGPILNLLVRLANQREDLRLLLTNVVLGNRPASGAGPLRGLAKLAFRDSG
jgi:menaquinone-9 beta-reductase